MLDDDDLESPAEVPRALGDMGHEEKGEKERGKEDVVRSRFKILGCITSTLFGSVEHAYDTESGLYVAIKRTKLAVMRKHHREHSTSDSPEMDVLMLGWVQEQKEVPLLRDLCVRWIGDFLCADRTEVWSVREYAPFDLCTYIQQHGRLSEVVAAQMLAPMAWALARLHMLGCFHLDIKPDNLLCFPRYSHPHHHHHPLFWRETLSTCLAL